MTIQPWTYHNRLESTKSLVVFRLKQNKGQPTSKSPILLPKVVCITRCPLLERLQGRVGLPAFSCFRGKAHKSHCNDRRQSGRGRGTSPQRTQPAGASKAQHTGNLLQLANRKSRCLVIRDHPPILLCSPSLLSHLGGGQLVHSLLISVSPPQGC